jgi:hypothetical protein
MSIEEQLWDLIDNMDGATAAAIKADPELFCLWRNLGNDFMYACHRAVALGLDQKEQEHFIALQQQLQGI